MKFVSRKWIITLIAVAMSLFHIYTSGYRLLPAMEQRTTHLVFATMLVFLIFPLRKRAEGSQPRVAACLDFLLVLLSFLVGAYVFLEYEGISSRAGSPNQLDTIVSVSAIVLVIEATRRIMGMAMCWIVFTGLAYAFFGQYLPPTVAHSGYTVTRVVNHMFMGTEGILGTALAVSATVVITFLIFGAFLEQSGATSSLTSIGYGLFGRFKGGVAKAAVLGSCLFGMMTGSQTANVAAVGTFTIPLMIRGGYKPIMAGAIEALASTGGMLVPPVMGAAAFIIPEMIVGGTYVGVMRAALIPGLLYYVAVFMFIQVQASKLGIAKVPKSELPKLSQLMKENAHLFIPIFVILYLLIIERVTTKKAGFWAIVAVILVSMVKKSTRMTPSKVVAALSGGARNALIVAMSCAAAGLIEGVLSLTGMGLRFSEILIYMAGGNMLILLFLTMIASLIIGLPLPPVTAYLILAILAAPALIKSGLNPMAAHLFIFFFGVLGNITPPSAPCSFAAAGIAKTDPLKTTNLAFLISAPTFIIPYLMVYSPELNLNGSIPYIVFRVITAFFAISGLSITFLGYFGGNLKWIARLLMLACSILLIPNHLLLNVVGYLIFLGIMWHEKVYPNIRLDKFLRGKKA
ncbi:MAG: TRAP transporter fused permease subunit [Proteobacteria bacterium]|nr:TRAP transporter fused permease subunit [Pseudomonadota bacterium]